MKTRCPCCGASLSLDVLMANDDAREALTLVFKIGYPLGAAVVRYLALFRPDKTELSMGRVAKLLGEITPDIQAQRISRNGQVFEAPVEAWLWAMGQAVEARDAGRLKTPLKTHGWLYEVISTWRPSTPLLAADAAQNTKQSKMLQGLAALEAMKK